MFRSKKGLTLIEVIASIVLIAGITFAIIPMVRRMVGAKKKASQISYSNQELRALYSIISRDVKNAFFITAYQLGWNPVLPVTLAGEPPPVAPDPPVPVTVFKGEKSYLIFSTKTHQRFSQDIPENEQHIVTYELKDRNLVRAESPRVIRTSDYDETEKFRDFVLLEDVSRLEFGYFNPKTEKYDQSWDTDRSEHFNDLPELIKVTIEYRPDTIVKNTKNKAKDTKLEFIIPVTQSAFIITSDKERDALQKKNNPGAQLSAEEAPK